MTWDALAEAIGMSPVWTCSACMGMNSMPQDKEENPKGDRVVLTLNGKFLPCKAW